jgi:hypothetical protein
MDLDGFGDFLRMIRAVSLAVAVVAGVVGTLAWQWVWSWWKRR